MEFEAAEGVAEGTLAEEVAGGTLGISEELVGEDISEKLEAADVDGKSKSDTIRIIKLQYYNNKVASMLMPMQLTVTLKL